MSLFVAIAGNIGAGKTSLARILGQSLGLKVYFETVDHNPYLEDFYLDMKRWSFNTQVYFLSERFRAHQDIVNSKKAAIQDRTIYEDKEIFARALYEQGDMSKRDYQSYQALNDHMSQFLKAPDLLVYLKKSVPSLITNIQKRNRGFEANIPIDYLLRLNKYYDDWIEKYSGGPVLTIESDNLDFVGKEEDFQFVLKEIQNSLPQPLLLELCSNHPKIKEETHPHPEQGRLF